MTHDLPYAYASNVKHDANVWAPFKTEHDWKLAYWAKMRGPGCTVLSELLKLKGPVRILCYHKESVLSLLGTR